MKRYLWILFFLGAAVVECYGQSRRGDALISNGVFIGDPDIRKVCDLWQSYLHSHPDSTYDNPYWNAEEKKKYTHFDFLRDHFSSDLYRMMSSYQPTILSITPKGDSYMIRTLFSTAADSGFSDPIAITEVYAKKTNGTYALYNAAPINTLHWQHHTEGHITFISPSDHPFNDSLARKMNRYIDSLARLLGEKPREIDYYYADTYDEILHAMGYDYFIGEGNRQVASGHAYPANHYVIGGGSNEWYPHEFIHMYAIPKYPHADEYFQEGIATLFGGSRGHSLDWLIRHADSILTARPDFNIDSSLSGSFAYFTLDYVTGSDYLFGGLICKIAMEKGGWNLLKNIMEYGPTAEEGRYKVLKDFFGVERKDMAAFLRKKISEYAAAIPKGVK